VFSELFFTQAHPAEFVTPERIPPCTIYDEMWFFGE
jgi:hypothetical protein